MLEGCFDHYVYLDFPGVGSARPPQDGSERAVVLSYNEWPVKSEVLWSGSSAQQAARPDLRPFGPRVDQP